ncbi:lysyl-tRNA synthetase [Candidatus Malacoplasma girerdii]|uniref:Lysine--tRNA ligase n=1 Tax=Candidatus Malacoplasma girerdii TaxID=1318617 RepID=A0A097ST42_9BACT|nr:lysyl-tRNA synthetase [Candidatus Malacoplasma girerdii]
MERKFNDQELIRREKLKTLINEGKNPFLIENFKRNTNAKAFIEKYQSQTKEQLHECHDEIIIAGRIMAIRQTFGVIKDFSGSVQFYLNKKNFDEKTFHEFKQLDIGDIIGLVGTPMKTNTGEMTVNVKKFTLLSKSLKPLPEKWHGLVDEEARARSRYVDLIMNDESMNKFITRCKILQAIRNFMSSQGYFEVETPILQPILGGAAARPFKTHFNALDQQFYLRIATELPLKKLIVGGFEKVYEIGRIFRNEGMDATHNPEFTSLEAYSAYQSLEDMMDLTEKFFNYIAKAINREVIEYKGVTIDWNKPFKRAKLIDIIKDACGVDFNTITTDEEAIKIAKEHNIELADHEKNRGHIIAKFFDEFGEKTCQQPTFVYDYPIEISPLAKKHPTLQGMTRRFELFICGKEFANAFSELNDPIDQYERFEAQLKERDLGNDEANEMDLNFIEALEYGLPPTGGIGYGIDRLVMLFTNSVTIRDVLLFPHMRKVD